MRTRRWLHDTLWIVCLVGFLGMGGLGGLGRAWAASESAVKDSVHVLAFTDFHGRLVEDGNTPGLAKFMGAVKAFKAQYPHTLVLAAGDLFTGTVESDRLHGQPTLEGLLGLGLAASAVGNHEFDWDRDDLARWRQAGLPFLSANVHDANGALPPGVEEGRIFDVGGMRVGVIGLTTTSTARTTKPENVQHLTFSPPHKALAPVVARLRAEGAEAVIVLAHLSGKEKPAWEEGIAPAIRKIARVPGVTAVVYGHSHQEHLGREGETVIVQPAYRGRSLAVIELTRDAQNRVLAEASLDRLWQRKDALPVDRQGAEIVKKAQEAFNSMGDANVAPEKPETANTAKAI